MFGYQESKYVIEKSKTIQSSSGFQTIEMRIAQSEHQWILARIKKLHDKVPSTLEPNRANKYISVQGKHLDILFLYLIGKENEMNSDWERIINEPEVHINELNWFERVSGHIMSVTREGIVIIY